MGYVSYPQTDKQLSYIKILFQDLGFSLAQKKDYLQLHHKVNYEDELDKAQSSILIANLKELKESRVTSDDEEE